MWWPKLRRPTLFGMVIAEKRLRQRPAKRTPLQRALLTGKPLLSGRLLSFQGLIRDQGSCRKRQARPLAFFHRAMQRGITVRSGRGLLFRRGRLGLGRSLGLGLSLLV